MEILIILPILISFLASLLVLPFWIRKANKIGLSWKDMNKTENKRIAGSGGLVVVMGFILGVLIYVAIKTFIIKGSNQYIEIFALTTSILLLAGIGIIDDIFGWQHGGLSRKMRIILVLFAAIPLAVINAGESNVFLPLFGTTDLGLLYPLILIPLGILGTSTTFNFIAGYNGLEAGQGIIILSALAAVSLITGSSWLSVVALCMVASLFAFLHHNKFPAKVFPGDILTYPVGGLIAIMAILGNYEMFAVFIFMPYIAETLLKLRGKLKKHSFGIPMKDGSIKMPYDKFYGIEHIGIYLVEKIKKTKKAYEWEVVLLIHVLQITLVLIGFLLFIF